MKIRTFIIIILLSVVAIYLCPSADAQSRRKKDKMPTPVKEYAGMPQPKFLSYEIVDGDTVYFDVLKPSMITGHRGAMKGKEWRRYYRLVWNFSKTYPYALVARKLISQTDEDIEDNNLKRRKKEKYINAIQDELFEAFETPLRGMTISQGQLLMKLIDREVGKSSYNIIKDYKNSMAAGFWQGVAKMFGSDLKKNYDPEGEDKDVEELIQIWEAGDFPDLYFSIFGEYPKRIEIPSKYR